MKRQDFEKLVNEGVEAIPEKFREKIKNVAFLIADYPTEKQLKENGVPEGDTLLGLYEGIPATERGEYYGMGETLPDRITIFQKPIEEEADGDAEKVREVVKDTIWHEVAHYFGMSEKEVGEREDQYFGMRRNYPAEPRRQATYCPTPCLRLARPELRPQPRA